MNPAARLLASLAFVVIGLGVVVAVWTAFGAT